MRHAVCFFCRRHDVLCVLVDTLDLVASLTILKTMILDAISIVILKCFYVNCLRKKRKQLRFNKKIMKLFKFALAVLLLAVIVMAAFVAAEEAAEKKDDDNKHDEKKENNNDNNDDNQKAVAADAASPSKLRSVAKRSIFQACRKDIERLCMAGGSDGEKKPLKGDEAHQARRKSLRNAASCLDEKKDEVKEESCSAWLDARAKCFDDVENACPRFTEKAARKTVDPADPKTKERSRGRKMMCLRTVSADVLSEKCRESDFYRAIIGLRRFHKKAGSKSGGLFGGKSKGAEGKSNEVKSIAKKMAEDK